jgi:hypothetical protein
MEVSGLSINYSMHELTKLNRTMLNHYSQIHTTPALLLRKGALIHTGEWMGHVTGHGVLENRKVSALARN